jgi:hypothetical protein
MYHKKSNELTFVIYDPHKKPRTFVVDRLFLKKIFLGLLLTITTLLAVLSFFIYQYKTKKYYQEIKFEKENFYLKERENLLAKIKLLTDENNNLIAKTTGVEMPPITPTAVAATPTPVAANVTPTAVAQTPVIITPDLGQPATVSVEGIFQFVKRPIGFKNLADQNLIKIDNIQLRESYKNISLNFDLINNANETKITGYAIVLRRYQNMISIYPTGTISSPGQKIPYNVGEQFGFSRMRPVVANFKFDTSGKNFFTILIFSRAGDLILKKDIGPYEIK